jgi:hypothetical protein
MTGWPIVERELLVASRLGRTYWSRISFAGVLFLVLFSFLGFGSFSMSPQRLGQSLFYLLTACCFIAALAGGAQLTSDCITSEKRDGTLGLLFLTPLTGVDVVFGKLGSSSLRALYGFLAVLPAMSILLLLGGVGMGEILRVMLVLLNTLFFSLSAGLLASCLCTQAKTSSMLAGMLVIAPTIVIPALGYALFQLLQEYQIHVEELPFFVCFLIWSPIVACVSATDAFFLGPMTGFGGVKLVFAGSLLLTHLLSWLMLLTACRVLPHRWQDRAVTKERLRWRDRFRQRLKGSPATCAEYRRRLLEITPIHWLTSQDRQKPAHVWSFLVTVVLFWVYGFVKLGRDWIEGATIPTVVVLHGGIKLWTANESVRQFAEDLRIGALELLLSTPLRLQELFRGQLLSLRRQFLGPVAAILVLDLLLLLALTLPGRRDAGLIWFAFLIVATVLVLDLVTIAWLGMWMAVCSKDAKQASGNTVMRILAVPWIFFYLGMGLTGFLCPKFGVRFDPNLGMVAGFWFAIGVAVDVYFLRFARHKLATEFRSRAMQRYTGEEAQGFWAAVDRQLGRAFRAVRSR